MDAAAAPRHAIEVFQSVHNLHVTVHDRSGAMWPFLSAGGTVHDLELCHAVKREPCGWRCVQFDVHQVAEASADRPEGFLKVCHAGLLEWVVPVVVEDRLLWVLFAGVRQPGAGLAEALTQRPGSTLPQAWQRSAARLPAVSRDEAERLLEALRQLAARLKLWWLEHGRQLTSRDARRRPLAAAAPDRRRLIDRFIREHHARPVQLADLARALGLGPDRTAHLVRELCQRTFVELITSARLETAQALLRHTDARIDQVAQRSGFVDVSHFHRVWRRHHAATPARWRRSVRDLPTGPRGNEP